ncbi:2031_t:CDS:2 [Ambispora leptoticha]|uniref:2031_t:CDS:1 n=1 Tax=Ambispora leptoticha TaxID=144679 RepID=A0A9N8YWM8_9GLOM|nr:2031_t:CDS:2 [Ambispora leptoticha]
MKRNIRHWNATQALRDAQENSGTNNSSTSSSNSTNSNNNNNDTQRKSSNSGRTTPTGGTTRSGYTPTSNMNEALDEKQYGEMESALRLYEDDHYIHAFFIPNYEEPEPLLRDTIKRLAQHRNSSTTYVIVLAMEASEANHAEKATNLKNTFEGSFREFIITVHPKDVPGESRGKGSNVAYAARIACAELVRKGFDKRNVVFTITDSDSAIPELYIRHVERALTESDDPYATICSPPIFFSRNALDVPAAVRVLAEKVGFWDTDQDAVGEDLHMWLKCFFKTGGAARTAPIFVPINLTNVQTTGYVSNLHARYVQAKRHYNGVADVAYSLKSAFRYGENQQSYDTQPLLLSPTSPTFNHDITTNNNNNFENMNSNHNNMNSSNSSYRPSSCLMSCSIFDKLVVVFHVLEAHMIPATSGWLMFAAVPVTQFLLISTYSPLSFYYPTFQNPIDTSEFYAFMFSLVQVIGLLLPVPLLLMTVLYEGLHRTVDAELFKKDPKEGRTWKNITDYAWLPVSAWLFMTLPSTLACMKRLKRGEEKYVVAEKLFSENLTH